MIRDNTTATTKGILLDNISLTANVSVMPIPEPSTLALLGIGLLIGAKRLRRKATLSWYQRRFTSPRGMGM